MSTPPVIVPGARTVKLTRDADGYKVFVLKTLVRTDDATYGPEAVLSGTAGLPLPGSLWVPAVHGMANESNVWATCQQDAEVAVHQGREGEAGAVYSVTQRFSTKPYDKRCKDEQVTDPLLVPQEVSGDFVKFMEEATHDRFGRRVMTSSREQVRGPQVEFDANRPQVTVKQNRTDLELALVSQMVDTVNAYTLWGFPPRTVKLSSCRWSRRFYGSCSVYYERSLVFDVRYRRRNRVVGTASTGTGTGVGDPLFYGDYETFDRDLVDEGTKVLRGHWSKAGVYTLERYSPIAAPTIDHMNISSGAGGTILGPGTNEYGITSVNSAGESTLGAVSQVSFSGSTSTGKVNIFWEAVPGADSYNVYGRVVGFPLLLAAGVTAAGADSPPLLNWQDLGVVSSATSPPTRNNTDRLPDKNNPADFIRFQDARGNVCRVILDGNGLPANVRIDTGTSSGSVSHGDFGVGNIHVERYGESDMLLLGIPTVF